MAQVKVAEGGSLKRFRQWIRSTFYDKSTVDGKFDAIGSVEQATADKAGIMKLFTSLGQNTDGAPTNKAVQDAISAISLKMYPVGSIYGSVSNVSPASFLGGSWERIKDRFLLSAGDSYQAGATGGEANHTLTEAEMPKHSHTRGSMNITGAITGHRFGSTRTGNNTDFKSRGALYGSTNSLGESFNEADYGGSTTPLQVNLDASRNWTGSTSEEGSGSAHNNLPPYLAVYMWKRTG